MHRAAKIETTLDSKVPVLIDKESVIITLVQGKHNYPC